MQVISARRAGVGVTPRWVDTTSPVVRLEARDDARGLARRWLVRYCEGGFQTGATSCAPRRWQDGQRLAACRCSALPSPSMYVDDAAGIELVLGGHVHPTGANGQANGMTALPSCRALAGVAEAGWHILAACPIARSLQSVWKPRLGVGAAGGWRHRSKLTRSICRLRERPASSQPKRTWRSVTRPHFQALMGSGRAQTLTPWGLRPWSLLGQRPTRPQP